MPLALLVGLYLTQNRRTSALGARPSTRKSLNVDAQDNAPQRNMSDKPTCQHSPPKRAKSNSHTAFFRTTCTAAAAFAALVSNENAMVPPLCFPSAPRTPVTSPPLQAALLLGSAIDPASVLGTATQAPSFSGHHGSPSSGSVVGRGERAETGNQMCIVENYRGKLCRWRRRWWETCRAESTTILIIFLVPKICMKNRGCIGAASQEQVLSIPHVAGRNNRRGKTNWVPYTVYGDKVVWAQHVHKLPPETEIMCAHDISKLVPCSRTNQTPWPRKSRACSNRTRNHGRHYWRVCVESSYTR